MNRREFLKAGGALPFLVWSKGCTNHSARTYLTSAAQDHRGQYFMVGLSSNLEETFRVPLPERGHEVRYNPVTHHVVAFARRPGYFFKVVDALNHEVLHHIEPPEGRLFYGHGDFDQSGRYLYTTENDYANQRGVIGVYDTFEQYQRIMELDAYGVGTHEIRCDHDVLYVANGGIATHPQHPRQKLNIPSMEPNLTLIDRLSGKRLSHHRLDDHQASVRHMDVRSGKVAVGLQHQTHKSETSPITSFFNGTSFEAQRACVSVAPSIKQYVASVAFGLDNQVVYTAPRGNQVLVVDHHTDTLLKSISLRDVAGVAYDDSKQCYWLSCGTGVVIPLDAKSLDLGKGRSFAGLKWDNHLRKA